MKNAKLERFRCMQRQHHRSHSWSLSKGGLFIPHSYAKTKPDGLSWGDDVGFILNDRRVIVWWQHPRQVYCDAIENQSWDEAGNVQDDNWVLDGSTKNYRKIGKSRKKIVSYTCRPPSDEQRKHYDKLDAIRKRMMDNGIDFDVTTSWRRERLKWADGISIVAPLEVRNETDLALVAALARRLILGLTTLKAEFPGYQYSKADWMGEQIRRTLEQGGSDDGQEI